MGQMRIMGGLGGKIMEEVNSKLSPVERIQAKGDLPVEWDPTNPKEVRYAREIFDHARKKGFKAFIVGGKGRGKEITAFDPGLGNITIVAPMAGGCPEYAVHFETVGQEIYLVSSDSPDTARRLAEALQEAGQDPQVSEVLTTEFSAVREMPEI